MTKLSTLDIIHVHRIVGRKQLLENVDNKEFIVGLHNRHAQKART